MARRERRRRGCRGRSWQIGERAHRFDSPSVYTRPREPPGTKKLDPLARSGNLGVEWRVIWGMSDKMSLTRRDTLKQALATIVAPSSFGLVAAWLPMRAYAASPTLMLSAAATVLRTIRSSSSASGGMSALLTAINGKLDIAISQLASIQSALAQIMQEISGLREDFSVILNEQYTYELVNDVQAHVISIQQIQKEAVDKGVDLSSSSQDSSEILSRIKDRYESFDIARIKMINSEYGKSSLSTVTCEICTAMDAMAYSYGIISREFFIVKLDAASEWLLAILSSAANKSATFQLESARGALKTKEVELQKASEKKKRFPAVLAQSLYKTGSISSPISVTNTFQFEAHVECIPKWCASKLTGTYRYGTITATLSLQFPVTEVHVNEARLIQIDNESDRSFVMEVENRDEGLKPTLISYGTESDRAIGDQRNSTGRIIHEEPFVVSFDMANAAANRDGWRMYQGDWWQYFALQAVLSRESYKSFGRMTAQDVQSLLEPLNEEIARIAYLSESVAYSRDHLKTVLNWRNQLST